MTCAPLAMRPNNIAPLPVLLEDISSGRRLCKWNLEAICGNFRVFTRTYIPIGSAYIALAQHPDNFKIVIQTLMVAGRAPGCW